MAEFTDIALFLSFLFSHIWVVGDRKIAQRPDDYRCNEDYSAHFFEILFALLPGVSSDGFPCWETIGRKFHHEGCVLAFSHSFREKATQDDGHDYTDEIERQHYKRTIFQGKERAGYHDVDGNSSRTTHHREDEHRDQSAATAFDGSG